MTISPPIAPDAGLPDEADISRWANALFSALPGVDGLSSMLKTYAPVDPAQPDPSMLNLRPTSLGGGGLSPGAAYTALPTQPTTAAPDVPVTDGLSPALQTYTPVNPAQSDPSVLNLGPGSLSGAGFSPGAGYTALPVEPTTAGVPEIPGEGLPPLNDPPAPHSAAEPSDLYVQAESFSRTNSAAVLPTAALPTTGLPTTASSPPLAATPTPAAAPQVDSNLYILAESHSRQTPAAAPRTDWVTARSDGAPGSEDLDALLGAIAQPYGVPGSAEDAEDAGAFHQAPALAEAGHPAFDVQAVRRDFPILQEKIHGRPLIWFDNGATTQKPQAVIDRLAYFYAHENSNVHRAAHTLAARATDAYENARKTVARFIGAGSAEEIVFARGATEAINLVAKAWGGQNVQASDDIIVSHLEHHANIVPWQQLAAEKGARLRVIPVDDDGQVLLNEYERLLSDRTKIVAVTHVSNALGTVVPIKAIIDRAHAAGAKVLIDAAQSIAHARIDVLALDADFLVFSGHKVFAPTGIGVLYGKSAILNATLPWQGGGNMIADVTFEKTVYQPAPARFEAGTGNLADAAGLGAALEYLERIGLENIARHEHDLLDYATAGLKTIAGLKLFGTAKDKVSVLSFLIEGFAPEEIGSALDQYGIAVRAGHHCAQPILRRLGVEGTVRASLALYNTHEDVDCLVSALRQIVASRGGGRPSA